MREIGQCPACAGCVENLAPAHTAYVQCPHCHREFALADLLILDLRPLVPLRSLDRTQASWRDNDTGLVEPEFAGTEDDDDLRMAPLDDELRTPTTRDGDAASRVDPSRAGTPSSNENELLDRESVHDSADLSMANGAAGRATADVPIRPVDDDLKPQSDHDHTDDDHLEDDQAARDSAGDDPEAVVIQTSTAGAGDEDLRLLPEVRSRTGDRSRRRQGRLPWELLKVVAGGLAGLVLAQLILWWLPGSMRRDPFGLAPRLPVWLQFAVPPELRSVTADRRQVPALPTQDALDTPNASQDGAWQPLANPFADESGDLPANTPSPEAAEVSLPPTASPHGAGASTPPLTAGDVMEIAEVTGLLDPDSTVAAEAVGPAAAGAENETGLGSNADLDLSELDLPTTPTLPADVPSYSASDLQQAIAACSSAMEQVHLQAGEQRSLRLQAARTFYERLAVVAQTATFLNGDDPQLGEQLHAADLLLREISEQPSLLALIGRTAAGWLEFSARSNDGIVVTGKVLDIELVGAYYEIELQLDGPPPPGRVVHVLRQSPPSLDPRAPYNVQDELFLLGSILTKPNQRISGYDKSEPVIWHGLHLNLSGQ